MRAWATVAAWLLGPPSVAASVVVLGDLGGLGWPSPARWDAWLHAGDPAVAVVATMRTVLVIACVLTSIRVCVAITASALMDSSTTVATITQAPQSLGLALQLIRRPALAFGIGISLVSSSTVAAGASTTSAATTGRASVPDGESAADDALRPAAPGVDLATAGGSYAELRRVRVEIAPRPDDAGGDRSAADEWVVAPGDHLWGIASETLAEHLGEEPSERRVRRYWQRLIEANEERFVIPGEPDVIWPGQRLVVPRLGAVSDQRSGT